MARRPRPVYTPVDPAPTDLTPEQLWADGGMTLNEAAAFCGRQRTAMKKLLRERKVPSKKDGKLRIIARRGLVLYLANLPD